MQEVRLSNTVTRSFSGKSMSGSSLFDGAGVPETPFNLGQRVRHSLFGEGTILNFEGSGPGSGAGEFRGRGQQMADAQLRKT